MTTTELGGIGTRRWLAPAGPLRVVEVLREALARRRERRVLAALDDLLLADIGVTRSEARTEAARGFWS